MQASQKCFYSLSMEEGTVLSIEVKDDSRFLWNDRDYTLSFEQRIVMKMWEAGSHLNLSNVVSFTISSPAAVAWK